MKTKEVKELTTKTKEELNKKLEELHSSLATNKLDLKLGRSNNSAVLKEIKRDIARVLTVLNLKREEDVSSK